MPSETHTRVMPAVPEDAPRVIVAQPSTGDKIFRGILRASGWSVFVITGLFTDQHHGGTRLSSGNLGAVCRQRSGLPSLSNPAPFDLAE